MSGIDFWINNPNFGLPTEEEGEKWCGVSRPLVEWGDNLLARLTQDPQPGKVGFAKWKLLDRYCRRLFTTTAEHRPETNLDNHPCLHQALLDIWKNLEEVELSAAIPELLPPPPPQLLAPVTEPEQENETEEVAGIVLGIVEDDEDDEGDDQSPAG